MSLELQNNSLHKPVILLPGSLLTVNDQQKHHLLQHQNNTSLPSHSLRNPSIIKQSSILSNTSKFFHVPISRHLYQNDPTPNVSISTSLSLPTQKASPSSDLRKKLLEYAKQQELKPLPLPLQLGIQPSSSSVPLDFDHHNKPRQLSAFSKYPQALSIPSCESTHRSSSRQCTSTMNSSRLTRRQSNDDATSNPLSIHPHNSMNLSQQRYRCTSLLPINASKIPSIQTSTTATTPLRLHGIESQVVSSSIATPRDVFISDIINKQRNQQPDKQDAHSKANNSNQYHNHNNHSQLAIDSKRSTIFNITKYNTRDRQRHSQHLISEITRYERASSFNETQSALDHRFNIDIVSQLDIEDLSSNNISTLSSMITPAATSNNSINNDNSSSATQIQKKKKRRRINYFSQNQNVFRSTSSSLAKPSAALLQESSPLRIHAAELSHQQTASTSNSLASTATTSIAGRSFRVSGASIYHRNKNISNNNNTGANVLLPIESRPTIGFSDKPQETEDASTYYGINNYVVELRHKF